MTARLRVLVVDDEKPARDEIAYLLEHDPRVGSVVVASSAAEALRVAAGRRGRRGVQRHRDAGPHRSRARPGAAPLPQFAARRVRHGARGAPVDAFELDVVDYLLKPIRDSRLSEAVRRVVDAGGPAATTPEETIPVELGGVTRFVRLSEVRYVEAQGDYTRLHTPTGSPLIRVPLATLEQEWADAGFVRIHRSHLIALAHVSEVRTDGGRVTVVVDGEELAVSRRHTRELRDLLVRRSRPGQGGRA